MGTPKKYANPACRPSQHRTSKSTRNNVSPHTSRQLNMAKVSLHNPGHIKNNKATTVAFILECNLKTCLIRESNNQITVAQNGMRRGNMAHMIRVEKKTSASDCSGYMHFKLTKCCPMTAVEREKKIQQVRDATLKTTKSPTSTYPRHHQFEKY